MDWPEMLDTVANIEYKDWEFHIEMREGPPWLQLRFRVDGKIQHCRKWLLSPHMTESEFVQTCLKAVLSAEEHEARERFLYGGKPIFGPHISVRALRAACDDLDARKQEAE